MNKFFLGHFKGVKNAAKYIIFSAIFVLSCVIGVDFVEAGTTSIFYNNGSATGNIAKNDNIGSSGLTPIQGQLTHGCTQASKGTNYYEYTLLGSTKGDSTDADDIRPCMTYTDTYTGTYFYLQSNATDLNTITFQIRLSKRYSYITLFEQDFSDSAQADKIDYDLYYIDETTSKYVYKRYGTHSDDAVHSTEAQLTGETLTFVYQLRDESYNTKHLLSVYFYDGDPNDAVETKRAELEYILAKPISDYSSNIHVDTDGRDLSCLVDDTNDQVCVLYTPNSYAADGSYKTNAFTVQVPDNAAIYFSTFNTHDHTSSGATVSPDNVQKYNSIYAVNTFYNEGSTDPIQFYYHNVKDETVYGASNPELGLTAKSTGYKFILTIDASGKYTFYIIDIFGNELKIEHDDLSVNDVANRDLTIYFLSYKENDPTKTFDIFGKKAADTDKKANFSAFELGDDLSVITKDNLNAGLEFYYQVQIDEDYGVATGAMLDKIKMNPLYYNDDPNTKSKQIAMYNRDGDVLSYYCRQLNTTDTSVSCVPSGNKSQFNKQVLVGKTSLGGTEYQRIDATYSGVSAITNKFEYRGGLVPLDQGISDTAGSRKPNLVDVAINENGRFYVYVQDTLGNFTSSAIDVSIIDQLQPVITLNNQLATFDNNICSSMYVIGAAHASSLIHGSGNPTTNTYPTSTLSDCTTAGNHAYYNHFAEVDPTNSALVLVERNGTANSGAVGTNGFYNTGSHGDKKFEYADAIRMALLRATDSISQYQYTGTAPSVTEKDIVFIEKSIYEKTEDTYTGYKLYTVKTDGTKVDLISGTRENFKNDHIIANNYLQYSSELKAYVDTQIIKFSVYLLKADGNSETESACSSLKADGTVNEECYKLVNVYIDKAISFRMDFQAMDYAGNTSEIIAAKINVIDDTTPGIASIDDDSKLLTDPAISKNNMASECRLEIGSIIQTRAKLLECYGFVDEGKYKFVDNATTYAALTDANHNSSNYYKNVLNTQLYGVTGYNTYDASIEVSICTVVGKDKCTGTQWKVIPSGALSDAYMFANAGSYEIRFVISDTGKDYAAANSGGVNTTTIILTYYVNPRVLLIRPLAKEKVYGQAATEIDYCIYATTNTNAFYENLFNPSTKTTYKYVLDNYESSMGRVYCTNLDEDDYDNGDGQSAAAGVKKYNEGTNQGILATPESSGVKLVGNLSRVYATGDNRLNMGMGEAYEEAGYYYITLGNLKIQVGDDPNSAATATAQGNYIIRLHPVYLLDGEAINPSLKNYYELRGDQYKYGVTDQDDSRGEVVSNVLYTIKQAQLHIKANGGSKVYGNPDTNYTQAKTDLASNNISHYTNITSYLVDGTSTTGDENGSARGYLNGFTVSGLNETNTLTGYMAKITDYTNLASVLKGYLRRQSGENVGRYAICNRNVNVIGNEADLSDSCNDTPELKGLISVDLSGKVYDSIGGTLRADADITYGDYILINSVYYKLTRNNTDFTTKKFTDYHNAEIWNNNDAHNDANKSLQVIANANNGNKNYYIKYEQATYTITPRKLIVQPGANQGKEYSNPTHYDPVYELVVYGERLNVSVTNDAAFIAPGGGYTAAITTAAAVSDKPDYQTYKPTVYESDGTTVKIQADSELYFDGRRTRTEDITGATYKYRKVIDIEDGKFELDGVWYTYASNKICLATLGTATGSLCFDISDTNEVVIGVNKLTLESGKIVVHWEGYLTYQIYELFTSTQSSSTAIAGAGTGKISRKTGELVGWYEYQFTPKDLRAVTNGRNQCTLSTTTYFYDSSDGSEACGNYNVDFTTNAPSKDESVYTTSSEAADYLHDGEHGSTHYDPNYPTGKDKIVLFFIFKREIILSFNALANVYGEVSGYYEAAPASGSGLTHTFYIGTGVGSVPASVTCYAKVKTSEKNDSTDYEIGGSWYRPLTRPQCDDGVDYGLSQGDTWGSDGLKLDFYIHSSIYNAFTTNYALPAGMYYVYAQIGISGVHENYKLTYVDYEILKEKDSDTKGGALDITPRPVKLIGTYYQKEYGQAIYQTYAANGTDLITNTNTVSGSYKGDFADSKIISIYDNHYYYCDSTSVGTYGTEGCAFESTTSNSKLNSDADKAKYIYDSVANVYLFTVIGADDASKSMINLSGTGGKIDDIYANFAGSPSRDRYSHPSVSDDSYGLLDGAGWYDISLAGISPVITKYAGVDFKYDNADPSGSDSTGTINRYTNYSIAGRSSGRLYITPAEIEIKVVDGQKKMYGCAYNTESKEASVGYTYESGYDCVETVGNYYDMGYSYVVKNDKNNFLMSTLDGATDPVYKTYSCTNLETGGCNDVDYSAMTDYTVKPSYGDTTDHDKPDNTALNGGNLYRISIASSDVTSKSYNYATHFGYATKTQINRTDRMFQEQKVGYYVITIGNLDAEFNGNDKCSANSMPLATGAYECKNFIIKYAGFNTSGHTFDNSTATPTDNFANPDAEFSFTDLDGDESNFKFEIFARPVVVTTEYNYKVYGDTDPIEGFTCLDLKNMFTYSGRYSDEANEFEYSGRDYCSDDDDFIAVGPARFYAIDNSLAKAPWTAWVDNAGSYDTYNDTLYDVFATSSKTERAGRGNVAGVEAGKDDVVGRYKLEYHLTLNNALNGANYKINNESLNVVKYLNYDADASSNKYSVSDELGEVITGFATKRGDTDWDRWYTDENHLCVVGTSATPRACDAYDGVETYKFKIKGLDINSSGANAPYTSDGNKVSTIQEGIYFEIVRREIYIFTGDTQKDYGIEDNYLMFKDNLKLCANDPFAEDASGNPVGCTAPAVPTTWGVRNSLSHADYAVFYPSGVFDPEAFMGIKAMGTEKAAAYRGEATETNRSFGIYFYRQYGEQVGDYYIVACATQVADDLRCRTKYNEKYGSNAYSQPTTTDIETFQTGSFSFDYNASNYIVKTIPSKITVNVRKLNITPISGQGFMYGNYESGDKIPPITFTEEYTENSSYVAGLVNGGRYENDDHINNQYALCIYNIAGVVTCINNRQNSTGVAKTHAKFIGYVTTGLHNSGTSQTFAKATAAAIYKDATYLDGNVYNDTYNADNTAATDRMALDRKINGVDGQRYNRNVGEYIITVGQLTSSARKCDASASVTTNCINKNYGIISFNKAADGTDNADVVYTITAATVTITPRSNQSKTYGKADVQIKFDVVTVFDYDTDAENTTHDRYYCSSDTSASCYDNSFKQLGGTTNRDTTTNKVTLSGFAYEENDTTDGYNYGIAKENNKKSDATNTEEEVDSNYDGGDVYPKFYDKYCAGAPSGSCTFNSGEETKYATLTYGSTARILLGYFYVSGWNQSAGEHVILSGIVIAKNNVLELNYIYNVSLDSANPASVKFKINKLNVDATIEAVTKYYGQATDRYKCDDGYFDECQNDYATLNAINNEGRLEYNFNVTDADGLNSVHEDGTTGVVILTSDNVDGKYYTQTGLAEFKNVHLGLTVVRKVNNTDGCLVTGDLYGCEDAGEYELVFRKQEVPQNVDSNYYVIFGNAEKTIDNTATATDYATVKNVTISYPQVNGQYNVGSEGNSQDYVIYEARTSVDEKASPTQIAIVSDYSVKLKILKRHIMFYVGTYNDDGSTAYRFTIEQNEQVPEFPTIEEDFTTSSTHIAKKELYYVTWFDQNEYVDSITAGLAQAPRQIRTGDQLKNGDNDAYGVVICTKSSTNIQSVVFGENCQGLAYGTNGEGVNGFKVVDGKKQYNFDTSVVGDYPILRNKDKTYIESKDHEEKNYIVKDHNGVLVIYEDQTAPVIQVGNTSFALEANAHTVSCDSGTIVNNSGQPFYYNGCDVAGLLFDENSKALGDIIKYIAMNYSGYNGAYNRFDPDSTDDNTKWSATEKSYLKLPLSIAALANSSWIYQPVNNMGKTSGNTNTTLYSVDRIANTYAFNNTVNNNDVNGDGVKDNEGVIDATDDNAALRAITTIISWFNVNSYDYSYLRGDEFDDSISKRYTPRYYFYIEGNDTLSTFDPTFVGKFKIYIYAMDDVGNTTDGNLAVELNIVDTTNPETGEMHIFNAPVVCDASDGNCKADSVDNWWVKEGYVPINAFRKYTSAGVEDNVNGTYIKLNGAGEANEGLIDIYGTAISRYMAVNDTSTNIMGNYVRVIPNKTPAMEVEHRYWSNNKEKYLVVIGGKDNSYIDPEATDSNSQWNTYYTIDGGSTWFKYSRHDADGDMLEMADGTTLVVTKVLDSGESFVVNQFEPDYYYGNVYLQYVQEGGEACKTALGNTISNCQVVTGDATNITQVNNAEITYKEEKDGKPVYSVMIHSITVDLTIDSLVSSKVTGKATWPGGAASGAAIGDNKFRFGIMICEISPTATTTGWKLNCSTDYKLVYKSGDKYDINKPIYQIIDTEDTRNLGAIDTSTPNPFYKDRMYIFIDTQAPTFEMNGQKYSVFEYDKKCEPSVDDDICKNKYAETFVNASDGKGGGTSSTEHSASDVISGTKLPTGLAASAAFPVAWYTLAKDNPDDATEPTDNYSTLARNDVSSGLLTGTSDIMGGLAALNSMATFNQLRVDLSVYLSMQSYKEQPDGTMGVTRAWYKYLAVYNGSKYYVYRIKANDGAGDGSDSNYAVIATFATTTLDNSKTTIKDVLEYIVSTASVDFSGSRITSSDPVLLTYSINYNIKDAAGNVSADSSNNTVRGVTLTKLSATVAAAANVGVSMQNLGDNRYQLNMNQGMSLSTLLDSITVSNVDISGNNNLSSIRQSLYYNGVALYENIGYNSDILATIENYLSAPGTYTLRLTSQREVVSGNKTFLVNDKPLELNFVVEAPRAITYTNNDYSRVMVTGFILVFASICLLATGYVVSKRKQDN